MELSGKHVLITGAGKRIGRALAEAFIEEEISLTAHGHRSQSEIEALVATSRSKGRRAEAVFADLKSPQEIKHAVQHAEKVLGPVDILINSASIFYPTPSDQCTEAQWNDLLDVNLRGQFFFAQAVQKQMNIKGGVILNIADTNALRPIRHHGPYLASKGGLLTLTESLAKDWAPKIRVNAISPGWVLEPEGAPPEQTERNVQMTLMKRSGSPEDIVEGARFLIRNDYITGFNLRIDGGRSIA